MWKVIVRCSLSGDDGAVMRAVIQKTLWKARLAAGESGAWECEAADPEAAAAALAELLQKLAAPSQVSGLAERFRMDHLQIEVRPCETNPRMAQTVDWKGRGV